MIQLNNYWIGIGDIHDDISQLNRITELSRANGLIINGDMTNLGHKDKAAIVINSISSINSNIYAQCGNMDYPDINDYLEEKGYCIHRQGKELFKDIGIIGVGLSSPTPFNTPGEVPDEQLGKWLEETYQHVKHFNHVIVVTHDPPYGTQLDKISGGGHVGSRAVLNFIHQYQPDVCLCGHIHESRGKDVIGKTKIVNPGMFSNGGYALITYEQGKLDIQLKE